MSKQSQISATISGDTKERLARFAASHGLEASVVVERALLYFMAAHLELPDEAHVPARLAIDDEAFDHLEEWISSAPPPTRALRDLMRGRGD